MARNVKRDRTTTTARDSDSTVSKTKISSKHQVTIARAPFEQAGFEAGEIVAVRALGPGRVELTSLDALFDKHRGRLQTGGEFRRVVDELHAEWD